MWLHVNVEGGGRFSAEEFEIKTTCVSQLTTVVRDFRANSRHLFLGEFLKTTAAVRTHRIGEANVGDVIDAY